MIAKKNRLIMWLTVCIGALLLWPLPSFGQDHGSGGSHGGGCGDVFGDLIHILRDADTGQPILAQRWVEMPAELPGYGWGYCPIAVNHVGGEVFEIPFLPFSCEFDLATDDPEAPLEVEEVDYFGRLNGGRTKERNNRMHFNEVISNIKQAELVTTDATGRLKLGFDCTDVTTESCYEFATVDSPMESMSLYTRLMKYGHFATDPYEIDKWAHGDPKLLTPFNPALDIIEFVDLKADKKQDKAKIDIISTDWDKFVVKLGNLMPTPSKHGVGQLEDCWDFSAAEDFDDANDNGVWDSGEPFFDMNENCVWDEADHEPFEDLNGNGGFDGAESFDDVNGNCVQDRFEFLCAGPERLDEEDFNTAAILLAAAASKTGYITMDLVQYLNRFLKITQDTANTVSVIDPLPALVRDCWKDKEDPFPADWEPAPGDVEPAYDDCKIIPADDMMPNYEDFPALQEMFVDFKSVKYKRGNAVKGEVDVILDTEGDANWVLSKGQSLLEWVERVNGKTYSDDDINGFVDAANDALRSIEYVHNYGPPEYLDCVYQLNSCPLY